MPEIIFGAYLDDIKFIKINFTCFSVLRATKHLKSNICDSLRFCWIALMQRSHC